MTWHCLIFLCLALHYATLHYISLHTYIYIYIHTYIYIYIYYVWRFAWISCSDSVKNEVINRHVIRTTLKPSPMSASSMVLWKSRLPHRQDFQWNDKGNVASQFHSSHRKTFEDIKAMTCSGGVVDVQNDRQVWRKALQGILHCNLTRWPKLAACCLIAQRMFATLIGLVQKLATENPPNCHFSGENIGTINYWILGDAIFGQSHFCRCNQATDFAVPLSPMKSTGWLMLKNCLTFFRRHQHSWRMMENEDSKIGILSSNMMFKYVPWIGLREDA